MRSSLLGRAVQLGAQLPLLLRGADYEGRRPQVKPPRDQCEQALFAVIENVFRRRSGQAPENAKQFAGAVFAVLNRGVLRGEADQVRHCLLPAACCLLPAIRILWLDRR